MGKFCVLQHAKQKTLEIEGLILLLKQNCYLVFTLAIGLYPMLNIKPCICVWLLIRILDWENKCAVYHFYLQAPFGETLFFIDEFGFFFD
jgi:hypothetical protein